MITQTYQVINMSKLFQVFCSYKMFVCNISHRTMNYEKVKTRCFNRPLGKNQKQSKVTSACFFFFWPDFCSEGIFVLHVHSVHRHVTPSIVYLMENQCFMPPYRYATVWWPIWKTSGLHQTGVPRMPPPPPPSTGVNVSLLNSFSLLLIYIYIFFSICCCVFCWSFILSLNQLRNCKPL